MTFASTRLLVLFGSLLYGRTLNFYWLHYQTYSVLMVTHFKHKIIQLYYASIFI